jgi:hypothetical protein
MRSATYRKLLLIAYLIAHIAESTCKLDAWAAPDGVPNPHRTARLASLRSLLAVKDAPVTHCGIDSHHYEHS